MLAINYSLLKDIPITEAVRIKMTMSTFFLDDKTWANFLQILLAGDIKII